MPDASNRYLTVANSVYDRRFSASNPQAKFVLEESKLLEFPKLVENSFVSVMKQSKMPALKRARIWGWAPDRLRDRSSPRRPRLMPRPQYSILSGHFQPRPEANPTARRRVPRHRSRLATNRNQRSLTQISHSGSAKQGV